MSTFSRFLKSYTSLIIWNNFSFHGATRHDTMLPNAPPLRSVCTCCIFVSLGGEWNAEGGTVTALHRDSSHHCQKGELVDNEEFSHWMCHNEFVVVFHRSIVEWPLDWNWPLPHRKFSVCSALQARKVPEALSSRFCRCFQSMKSVDLDSICNERSIDLSLVEKRSTRRRMEVKLWHQSGVDWVQWSKELSLTREEQIFLSEWTQSIWRWEQWLYAHRQENEPNFGWAPVFAFDWAEKREKVSYRHSLSREMLSVWHRLPCSSSVLKRSTPAAMNLKISPARLSLVGEGASGAALLHDDKLT